MALFFFLCQYWGTRVDDNPVNYYEHWFLIRIFFLHLNIVYF